MIVFREERSSSSSFSRAPGRSIDCKMDRKWTIWILLNDSWLNSRTNGESNGRAGLSASVNLDEKNGLSSPRFSSFRPVSERSTKSLSSNAANEIETKQSLWNGKSSIVTEMDIEDHEAFVKNKTYNIYLSNLQVPNIVFAATMDDYVNATLLITQMNKHEKLSKMQGNSYKSK